MNDSPIVLRSIAETRDWSREMRRSGTLGFVPTMGALHEGHAELMREAARECGAVAVSIYVNPTQFGPKEDLGKYPRTFESDLELCRSVGVKAIFFPSDEIMYPHGRECFTAVEVPGLTTLFEGASRPGHFVGVATVVTKLFGIVQPDFSYFGRKDYQQWLVIKRMTEDLNLGVNLRRVDTIREHDGLAMSSRNRYLSTVERSSALSLSRSLKAVENALEAGERRVKLLEKCMMDVLGSDSGVQLDYARIVNADNLRVLDVVESHVPESAVALIAARVGTTRLIDNLMLPPISGRTEIRA
jgi:pantoate--beta-alanine ligase